MSTFRDTLLAEATDVCRQLYDHRLAASGSQARISEKAKADLTLLVVHLHDLFVLVPFPTEAELDAAPLTALKADLAAREDPEAIERRLMEWVRTVSPAAARREAASSSTEPDAAASGAVTALTSPLNQRMIDGLTVFRKTIDRTRMRLLKDRDRYDRAAYTAARNAFTLARTVYSERLRLDQVAATNEDCARLETELIPAVAHADGATFPDAIRAGADFASALIFA